MKPDFDVEAFARRVNRRTFLQQSAYGMGGLALQSLIGGTAWAKGPEAGDLPKNVMGLPHFPIRAKRIIHLCMAGGPSQFESFDNKPILKAQHGQPFPTSLTQGQQLAQLQGAVLKARGSFVDFKKWGKSGQEISTLFPHIGGIADDICIVRSMTTEQIAHIMDGMQSFDAPQGQDRRHLGLGLYIVDKIVRAHHGEIGVESTFGE
ncbi:MAG: DUF1501 domain-containing protein, partial [Armatimonadota bacterium]